MATAMVPLAPTTEEAFTEEVLKIITMATWPDGSALVDVADEVLRRRLSPQLLAAAKVLAATTALRTGASIGGVR